jgi:hypothetical protein
MLVPAGEAGQCYARRRVVIPVGQPLRSVADRAFNEASARLASYEMAMEMLTRSKTIELKRAVRQMQVDAQRAAEMIDDPR